MAKLLLIISIMCSILVQAVARELPTDMLPVDFVGVQRHPETQSPVVLLNDPQSQGLVPIFIGEQEAQAIIMAIQSVATPRPLTHDTAVAVMRALDGDLERLIIDELSQNTYFGLLEIHRPDSPSVFVDVRPSDGIALAVRTGAAIWVSQDLLVFPDESGRWQSPARPSL